MIYKRSSWGDNRDGWCCEKGFRSADEVHTPDKTRPEIVDRGGVKAARMTAQRDAWVTSDQPFVAFEFDRNAAGSYGKLTS